MLSTRSLQYFLGTLFSIGFLASLYGILSNRGDSTALRWTAVISTVALFATAVVNRIREFNISATGVSAKLGEIEHRVDEQDEKLKTQQDIINKLVIYSLAAQPYDILWKIKNTAEYIYKDTENTKRWMNVLLDNGLIEPKKPGGWLQFDKTIHDVNLVQIAKTTPAGDFLISLRGKPN